MYIPIVIYKHKAMSTPIQASDSSTAQNIARSISCYSWLLIVICLICESDTKEAHGNFQSEREKSEGGEKQK